mmetsp:Transcript_74054/g.130896  ORF Transcript_74054/g.130896 Transcript_74054/m.130896 type:complete len:211 (-) Transcript_74054:91-723(-)
MLSCTASFIELASRVIILISDVYLIIEAARALLADQHLHCDEALQFYCSMCITLCVLDMVWECVRCTLESSLDRLQQDSISQAIVSAGGNENLLAGQEFVGSPVVNENGQAGSLSFGSINLGIRIEKQSKQKKVDDLQFWSILFTLLVAFIFAVIGAHDEECAMKVPHLFSYVHMFSYIFIFRVAVLVLFFLLPNNQKLRRLGFSIRFTR